MTTSHHLSLSLALSLAVAIGCGDSAGPDDRLTSLSGRIVFTSDRSGEFLVWTMRPDGSDLLPLTDEAMDVSTPAVSPDGRTLLLSDGFQILAMDVESRRVWVVAQLASAIRIDWSAATGLLVVSHFGPDSRDISIVDPATGAVTPLLTTSWEETSADWSPDGAWIVFSSNRDVPDGLQLYAIRPDGSDLRRLTVSPDDFDGQSDWSPSGAEIAFRRLSLTAITEVIGVLSVATGVIDTIDSASDIATVRYSPDGTRFLVDRQLGEAREIWLLNSDGTGPVPLTQSGDQNVNPFWVP